MQSSCLVAPVRPRIGSGDDREIRIGNLREYRIPEELERDDVGEVAEGADEEQAAAGRLWSRLEAIEVDAVLNYARVTNSQQFAILVRHHDDPLVSPDGSPLKPPP